MFNFFVSIGVWKCMPNNMIIGRNVKPNGVLIKDDSRTLLVIISNINSIIP
jgi:hypothetical protein